MKVPISHPEENNYEQINLLSHLQTVSERIFYCIKNTDINNSTARVIGYCHDLPKLTDEFQEYLNNDDISSSHNHAPSAAVFALGSAIETDSDFRDSELLLIYNTVYYHHRSRLDTDTPAMVAYEHIEQGKINDNTIIEQARERCENMINSDYSENLKYILSIVTNNNIDNDDDIYSIIDSAENWLNNDLIDDFGFEPRSDLINKNTYEDYIQLWSSLALADISHSARVHMPRPFERPKRHIIDNYVSNLNKDSDIDIHRSEARNDALENTNNTNWEDTDVGTLSLPTGLGKTLTGLSVALDILDRRELNKDDDFGEYKTGQKGKVIYALPYTSIIDQTADTFENIFDTNCTHTSRLTKHHYLSNTKTSSNIDDIGEIIGESWFSGVTVTTFVQLFESIICPTRTSSTKLPQLEDSIIILDEPQALPRDWWSLVQRIIQTLSEKYNCKVISMTATPPYIFKDADDLNVKSLLTDTERYYDLDCVKRVRYKIDESVNNDNMSYDILKNKLLNSSESGSTLAVLNTINSVNKISDILHSDPNCKNINEELKNLPKNMDKFKEKLDDKSIGSIVDFSEHKYLHINITNRHRPIDRRRLIEIIKTIDSNIPLIVTSTQILEAGVDVSFTEVYRDIAPIQNIVQTAGRCNRNNESDIGYVNIISLNNPKGASKMQPGEAIYNKGTNVIGITKDILSEYDKSINQKELDYNSVREYYDKLWKRTKGELNYVNYYNNCDLKELSTLSLIESNKTVDVLAVESEDRIRNIRSMFTLGNFEDANKQINEIIDQEISVPIWNDKEADKIAKLEELHNRDIQEHRYLNIHRSEFYTYRNGFEIPDTTANNRIL